ncbi:fumarylacetoacetate hydrolase family protein [Frankia sp. Cas3]|uniref:fumarylacetoacetate hydrolase family protein n=1 Tax=Frankia sp. Cas3 TaxID=3073926 RepID=UPI002AD4413E|nr:fumarylacetoacetate hydrolase family protein [Frankia sp. Cas3]
MRLARFATAAAGAGAAIGVIRDAGEGDAELVDITDLSPVPAGSWPPVADVALIAAFGELRPRITEALATRPGVALASARLLAPVGWPSKLLAYPANYHAHIAEMTSKNRADRNGFFLKAPSSLSGPAEPIVLPDLPGREIHHECELAIIIGRGGRHISRPDALGHIFGYSCLIDVTVRGAEERVMRKSYDTFTPLGPWIVTADEVADPDQLDVALTVNGELRQKANTRSLIVDVREMIVLASSVTTLHPGDVIATGTPEGVGPLRPGDEVTIAIESVGSMSVPVIRGVGGTNIAFDYEPPTSGGPAAGSSGP